jgi:hypothetical protein
MSPPTEQLIRDYLNRLSVAARGQLSAEDRRALVTLTHDFIERNASESGPPTAMEVAALLSRLGDPGALVEQEVARLAEARGASAGPADAERAGRLHGLLRRRNTPASWHWPAAPGSPDLRRELLNEASARPAANGAAQGGHTGPPAAGRPVWPSAAPRAGSPGPGSPGPGTAEETAAAALTESAEGQAGAPGGAGEAGPGELGAREPGPADAHAGETEAPAAETGLAALGLAEPPASVTGLAALGLADAYAAEPDPRDPPADPDFAAGQSDPAGPGRVRMWLADIASRALAGSRRSPMEATAVILLGLGGLIYPPVWLLGACIALASKVWDYRDKWAGLGGALAVMIIGTAACLALGTSPSGFGSYLHETWVYLNIWSRVGAVAGTWYLVWRLAHERPTSDVPPWSRPRRVD